MCVGNCVTAIPLLVGVLVRGYCAMVVALLFGRGRRPLRRDS